MVAWFIPLIAAAMGNSDNQTMRTAGQLLNMAKKETADDIAKKNTKNNGINTKNLSDMM